MCCFSIRLVRHYVVQLHRNRQFCRCTSRANISQLLVRQGHAHTKAHSIRAKDVWLSSGLSLASLGLSCCDSARPIVPKSSHFRTFDFITQFNVGDFEVFVLLASMTFDIWNVFTKCPIKNLHRRTFFIY